MVAMKRRLISVLIASVFLGLVLFSGSEVKAEEIPIVGGSYDYFPYSFLNAEEEPDGFTTDITKAIYRNLNREESFRLEAWAEVRASLEEGRTQLIQDIIYSPERAKTYAFSSPYHISPYILFIKQGTKNSYRSAEDLNGKRIIAVRGDIGHDYLGENRINAQIHLVDDYSDAIMLLEKGEFDLTMMDQLAGLYWIKTLGAKKIRQSDFSLFNVSYCYAALPENRELLLAIDGALAIMRESGEYSEIYQKWMDNLDPFSPRREDVLRIVFIISFPAILIIILLVLWSYLLRKKVSEKTRQLNEELEYTVCCEEELRASYEEQEQYIKKLDEAWEKLEKQNKKNEENNILLATTLASVSDAIVTLDKKGGIILFNKMAEDFTGISAGEAHGKNFYRVFQFYDQGYSKIDEKEEKSSYLLPASAKLTDTRGRTRAVKNSIKSLKTNGDITGFVIVIRDVTEENRNLEEIAYLSYHDQLTDLYNRRFFEEELRRLDTSRNLPLTIVMSDVNGLKLTNDAFGHLVGDELLKKTAEMLKNNFRAEDIIARIGGDEFVVLLPQTDYQEAQRIVERIISAPRGKNRKMEISVSFGWETKNHPEQSIMTVMKKAEDAMYKCKLEQSPRMKARTISKIITALYEKESREEKHSLGVAEIALRIGKELELPNDALRELEKAALLHDIGKIAVEAEILNKREPLSAYEWEEVMRHSEVGYRILGSVSDSAEIAEVILAHHERWDGTGYPRGLKEKEIPLFSRIIALADSYDAMLRERPYCHALTAQEALAEISSCSATQFDPELVKIFIELLKGEHADE